MTWNRPVLMGGMKTTAFYFSDQKIHSGLLELAVCIKNKCKSLCRCFVSSYCVIQTFTQLEAAILEQDNAALCLKNREENKHLCRSLSELLYIHSCQDPPAVQSHHVRY